MIKITYHPSGTTVEGVIGENLLETALDNDIEIDHNCGGVCACSTCAVSVETGLELLSPMQPDERETLDENDKTDPHVRLACQSRILDEGEILVTQVG